MEDGVEDICLSLHQGLFEQPTWHTFLCKMRQRFRADFCGLYLRESGWAPREGIEFFVKAERCVNPRDRWLKEFYAIDPIPYNDLHPGRVYSLNDFISLADSKHQTFMTVLMIPNNIRYLRFVQVEIADGSSLMLIVWNGRRDFSLLETDMLLKLAPHLTVGLESYAKLSRERLQMRVACHAMSRLQIGWIGLDLDGCVVEADDAGATLLEQNDIFRAAAGRLVPRSAEARKGLADALFAFRQNPAARSRAIRLSHNPGIDMLLTLMPTPVAHRWTGATPPVIVYVRRHARSDFDHAEQLMDLFGLTRSEAGIAMALARGDTLAQASNDCALTIETVRNYSKRIYLKTDTRGQADLVRLMRSGVLSLAEPGTKLSPSTSSEL